MGAVAINPALYEKLSYDPMRDLTPVSLVVNNVEMFVVAANATYNTDAEPAASSAAELSKLLASDTAKWTRVVKSKNMKPD